jgi:hypothetical protein
MASRLTDRSEQPPNPEKGDPMLTAYDESGMAIKPGQLLPGRDGALYEFIEISHAPTSTTFGKVRMTKTSAAERDASPRLIPQHSSQVFADVAFGLTIR